jgi:TPR repeat protein
VTAGVDAYNLGDLNNLGTSNLIGPGEPLDKPLGTSLIARAAMRGHAGSQQLLRRAGYGAPLPAAADTSGMMRLVTRNARAGHAQVCGELIS